MNIIRRELTLLCRCPQITGCRGLRGRAPKPRHGELEMPTIPLSSAMNIPAFQTPLTEQELSLLYVDIPEQDVPKPEKVSPKSNPKMEPVTTENQFDRLAEVVTPLYKVGYKNQLQMKQKKVRETLKMLGKQLKSVNAPINLIGKGLACPLEQVRPSPDVVAYRNQDELGIHMGADGNPKTVGYFVGKVKDPLITCVPATYLINMKDTHKLIAQKFQTFIRQSPLDACLKFDLGGIWYTLLVRSTRSDEKMATVCIHPQDLAEEEILEIMDNLQNFFFHGEGADCELDSLYLQANAKSNRLKKEAFYRHIKGKEHITETCEGLSFRISPSSFFQINTSGAEVLYRTVKEIAEVSPVTTLVDICSGTGVVSLIMAPHVRGTVGIEAITSAVTNAKQNAVINNIQNAHFIAGTADKVLPRITPDLNLCSDVVAVMNPARSGLSSDVIKAIRECEAISKIVYISCKPEGEAMKNFVELASTKGKADEKWKVKTSPFLPKYAVPVDMFPHTYHTDVVFLFERITT